jgi:hypothetical protein
MDRSHIECGADKCVIRVDAAVLAVGQKPRRELAEKFVGKIQEIHVVGDCAEFRTWRNSLHEGAQAGCEVCVVLAHFLPNPDGQPLHGVRQR